MIVLVIVSSLGIILYNIALESMSNQQNNLINNVNDEKTIAQERFEIVAVTRTNNNQMNITYINYGNVDVKITDIYINNVRYAPELDTIKTIGHLDLNSVIVLNFTPLGGEVYNVLIVSQEGVSSAMLASI